MSSNLRAADVRSQFIRFFEERGHRCVPSSPVFPQDDPTLLFTNAGMNQFKDVFLGTGSRDYTRAVNSQKCIRVSGKHNDLEEVGVDHYHHTFFEMLGNWSFGDYFKREAIGWSWELLTRVWKLPKERLWVTVFGGDDKDGLPADDEAFRLWRERTDIAPERILRFGRKANFWEMGETGPCGPCSEIHIDTGGPETDVRDGAHPERGVNGPNARFLELWNNVFMEFSRLDGGKLVPLPSKHVDTGMGLERIVRVLNGKTSNYDTDLFEPLFRATEKLSGKHYGGSDARADVAFRVVADHARAVSVAFADGALPSNTGRGYVLRRLIRRAARYGRQELGLADPFLCELAPSVAEILGEIFPEVRQRMDHIRLLLREEEASFGRTLGRGLSRFEELETKTVASGKQVLPGAAAFELYATYGFPEDLIELMAREKGLTLDRPGFDAAEKAHQQASRSEGKFKQLLSPDQLAEVTPNTLQGTASISMRLQGTLTDATLHYHDDGPTAYELPTVVNKLFREPGKPDRLILQGTPFYPEGGGQTGDTGHIEALDGRFNFTVEDTQRSGGVIVHIGRGQGQIDSGAQVRACVDRNRRERTRKNHTATHLLHKALRDVLGKHVTQQGSYVGPDRLRFDFSHSKGMTSEEQELVERLVNEQIIANAPVATSVEDLEAAKARGVMALFGEKYDAKVRVVQIGAYSQELCGGTHVRAAGDIGPFLITQERAVQAGVRRIEAMTGTVAVEEVQRQRRLLEGAARSLKAPVEELEARIALLLEQLKEARKKSSAGVKADLESVFKLVQAQAETRSGVVQVCADLPDLDGNAVRELAGRFKGLSKDLALALFGREEGRVPFLILCEGKALASGLKAGDLAKLAAQHLGGGGGGRPEMAQGQGSKVEAAPAALEAIRRRLADLLPA